MKLIKILTITAILLALVGIVSLFCADYAITQKAINKTFHDTDTVPHNKVGLLLGTSKYATNGKINLYYQYRIEAANELYKSGKIHYILVSGDNSREEYNEPTTIQSDLIESGIPEKNIILDYAGFRTLDSIVRSKEIFGQEHITIISQQFHNERAIYIAEQKGIEAIGYNAKDVNTQYGLKTRVREYLARANMFVDIFIGKEPKYYGEQIEIGNEE